MAPVVIKFRRQCGCVYGRIKGPETATSALEQPGRAPLLPTQCEDVVDDLGSNTEKSPRFRIPEKLSQVNEASLDRDFWAVHFCLGFPEYLYFQDIFRKEK